MVKNLWQFASCHLFRDEDYELPLYPMDTQEGFLYLSDPGNQVAAIRAWLQASVLNVGRLRRGRPPKSFWNFAPRPFSPGIRAPPPIFISGLPKVGQWLLVAIGTSAHRTCLRDKHLAQRVFTMPTNSPDSVKGGLPMDVIYIAC